MKKLIFLLIFLLTTTQAFGQALPVMDRQPEDWEGCGTATSSTGDVAIKAALTNAFIYVTSITCTSTDADNATSINFKDGTTVIAVGGVGSVSTGGAGAAGIFAANFLTPLRTAKNAAFNFNTVTSTASVICCATGYVRSDL